MENAIGLALSFPLILFTLLLVLAACYWLLVVLRLAPVELFEHDSLKGDHLASTMVSLGFAGVPASVAVTVLLIIAGAFTLAIELAVLQWLALGMFRVPVGVVVLWASFVAASPIAEAICRRMHVWFHRHPASAHRCQLGETVRVIEHIPGSEYATAVYEDDPSNTVHLHAKPDALPEIDERRVLVKYLPDEDAYRSVPAASYLETRAYLSHLRLMHKRHRNQNSTTHNNGSAA
ncbi:hypothetical protein [Aidingimonas halophila]|uniref:DUF1449 family protein n=1 Tax=Aidingimonas halophila TaxID=574349 RepID=A0A1H3EIM4_9GAMM|nr:hypothetical protein [Aidingimonas halophila]GHC33415.1 hypothetical protein GCM10008094_27740 [Aidingimonas halophila]SDX77774.1 hypothetical protein SAMN05443545_107119 [Aidingimonas halophila]